MLAIILLLGALSFSNAAYTLVYDRPTSCTGSARPGLVALQRVTMRTPGYGSIRNGGIYNCRSVRGAGSISEHAEGRAWDAMLTPGDAVGQRLADFLVSKATDLGIQAVIYNRRVWGYGRYNWRSYSGVNPHVDHVHVSMQTRAANEVTEAMVEAAFAGAPVPQPGPGSVPPVPAGPSPGVGTPCSSGGRTGVCKLSSECQGDIVSGLCPGAFNIKCCLPAAVNPPPVNPPPTATACRDTATGQSGTCVDVAQCQSGNTKAGLCPGPANIRCCFNSGAPAPGPVPPTPLESCVRATTPVYVRSSPSRSSSIVLATMAGEEFSKSEERSGWFRVSNNRGSGWSYGTYFAACGAPRARSLASSDADQQDDGSIPRAIAGESDALPGWAFAIIGFAVGVAIGGFVVFFILRQRSNSHSSAETVPLMSAKVGSAGSSSLIPQLRKRNSFSNK